MKVAQKKPAPASRAVARTAGSKSHAPASAKTGRVEANRRNELSEKALKQELKQRTLELRQTRQELKRLQANTQTESLAKFPSENPNPVLRVSKEGVLLYANHSSQALLDEARAAVGQPLPESWKTAIREAQQKNSSFELFFGKEVFSFDVCPIPGEGYTNLYGHDITQRIRAEEALQEREHRLQDALELLESVTKETNVIIAAVNKDFCYTFFNQAYREELKRLSGKDIHIGTNMVETFAHLPEQQKTILAEWSQVLAGESTNKTLAFGDPGLYQRTYNVLHTPIRDARGNVVGAGEVAYDITEQVRMQDALRQSEERYRTLFNSMVEGFALHEIICDEHGKPCDFRFLDINPAFEKLTGLQRADVVGRTHNEVLPDDSPKWVEAYGKVALTGEPLSFDNYSPALHRHYEVSAYQSMPGQFAVIFLDITARKRMEQSLRESDQRFRLALTHAPVSIAIQDRDLRFLWAHNQRTMEPSAIIGKTDVDLFSPEDAARLVAIKRQVLDTEKSISEQLWITSGGKRLFLDLFIEPLRDASGQVTGIGIATVDLTPMKEAEQVISQARDELERRVQERTRQLDETNAELRFEMAERRQAEVQLRLQTSAMEAAANGIFITDNQGGILWCNPAFAQITGYDSKEVIGRNPRFLKSGRHDRAFYDQMWQTLLSGQVWHSEMVNRRKDGSLYTEEQVITPVRDEQNQVTHFIAVKQDISARKLAEEELRLANAYNRSLIEASLDPLVTITPEGKIGDVNQATEKVTGHTRAELIGTDFHSYFSDPDKARAGYKQVFETGSVRDYNLEIRNQDGSITPVLYNASVYRDEAGKVLGVFAAARDITDRKQFENQLIQAEKHAVIGRMVGSITHEINNPLQTIKNCLYLIQQDVTADNPIQEPLEMAASETLRITNLVGQLRELYRPKTSSQKEPHEILDILEEAHSLLIPHLNNARVQWRPLNGLQRCYIDCERDQIMEVFLNISMNAIEAMQAHGGTLSVDMEVSGDWAAVIFRDTGPGIPQEMMPHLFEPFMTTKASGLGLGLSITYGILQRHGGQIQVENQHPQGASFTILLPLKKASTGGEEEDEHGNE